MFHVKQCSDCAAAAVCEYGRGRPERWACPVHDPLRPPYTALAGWQFGWYYRTLGPSC